MPEKIRVVIMLVSMIGAFVLLFVGFRAPTKELQKDDGPHKIPKEILIRSTIMLVGCVLLLGVFAACSNYEDYQNGLCTLSELFTTNIGRIIIKFGWVVLFPWLFNIFAKTKKPKEKDQEQL